MHLPIETVNPLYGLRMYPTAQDIKDRQLDIHWTAKEIPVEKDVQDFKHNMSYEQFNLASITLDTFVEIEQSVGNVWLTIASWFPHSEIEGACTVIAAMEKGVHADFYQKMSDEMNIPPELTAKNQQEITVLKNKLSLISTITSDLSSNKPLSLATVSLIEQVLLFSNFAMLKSFQANGNNLITNTITGVDFVIADETLHGVLASYLHNTWWKETNESVKDAIYSSHCHNVHNIIREVVSHEDAIIDYVFKGLKSINDITPAQLKAFVRSRADSTLTELNIPTLYDITNNPISEWFYRGVNSIKLHDFFVSGTSQYRRGWSETKLRRTHD